MQGLTKSRRLSHLRRCQLFRDMTADQIRGIATHGRCRTFAAGCPIYVPSERADTVFLVVTGLVKICHLTPDGKQSILALVESAELFGERAILESMYRAEYAEAVEDTTVLIIPMEELHRVMMQFHHVSMTIIQMMGKRRYLVERRLTNRLFLSSRDRLIHLLLDLAEQFGVPNKDGICLRVKLTHQDLANWIGSTRETVTLILGNLKSEGLIDLGRQKIGVKNLDTLAQMVNRQVSTITSNTPLSTSHAPMSS